MHESERYLPTYCLPQQVPIYCLIRIQWMDGWIQAYVGRYCIDQPHPAPRRVLQKHICVMQVQSATASRDPTCTGFDPQQPTSIPDSRTRSLTYRMSLEYIGQTCQPHAFDPSIPPLPAHSNRAMIGLSASPVLRYLITSTYLSTWLRTALQLMCVKSGPRKITE